MATLFGSHNIDDRKADFWLGTAESYLSSLEAGSVDLLLTSPPYFVGKEYDTSTLVADFVTELRRTIPLIVDALKVGGSVCWQVGNHVSKGRLTPLDAIIIAELASHQDLVLRNRIIWTFGHGSHAARRYSGRHETVLWYTKGENYFFNLDAARVPQIYPGKRHYKGPKKGEWSGNPLGKNPGDVWDTGDIWGIPNVKAHHIEKTEHPCQFPTALARRLIAGLSPKDGLVVDPYLGAGSAGVAALVEGRNFGGSDIERRYLEIASSRLEALASGKLKLREDKPVRTPRTSEQVSQLPPHFAHAMIGAK